MHVIAAPQEVLAWPARRQRAAVLGGELSVLELVQAALDRVEETDPQLHAFFHVAYEAATAAARELDTALRRGAKPGPLFGVPVSVKDLLHVAGMPTTAGSLAYRDDPHHPDSIHATRLRAAGAVIVGKTSTSEFGLIPRATGRLQPETVNPWNLRRTAGGSSGGAAASIAAGVTPIAVTTDGGGSTRIPAALCGLVGMLPSRGLVPWHGGVGGTLLFSSVGPLAADVRDLAGLLQVLAGPVAGAPLAWTTTPPDLTDALDAGIEGVRLRWLAGTGVGDLDPRVVAVAEAAARSLTDAGGVLHEEAVTLDADRWQPAIYAMSGADRLASVGQQLWQDGEAREALTDYAKASFTRAQGVTGWQYSDALAARYAARQQLLSLFEETDLLLAPTTCVVAPLATEPLTADDLVGLTNFCNFTGLPAATVPGGQLDELPVGLQIVGRPGDDAGVLRACRAIECMHPVIRPARWSR